MFIKKHIYLLQDKHAANIKEMFLHLIYSHFQTSRKNRIFIFMNLDQNIILKRSKETNF